MVVEIPIILAADENYAKYMYITILSALENKNDKTIYKFFLLVPKEFEEKTSNYFYDLEKKYKNTSIKFVEMREDFQNHTMSIRHITSPTYYRLRAAELLRSYDKSIYLDVDVIINKDLSELYDIELGDNYIAGVKAATYIMKKYNLKYYKSIGLPETSQYINAGVTLWNLAKIREDNLSEKLFELSMQNFSSMDQDVINVAFYNNIKHLDLKYNLMTKYDNFQKPKRSEYKKLAEIYGDENIKNALKNPVIIHYADQRKPWNCDSVMLSKYWWRYAKMSPYYKEIYKTYRKKYPRIKQVFQVTNVGVHKVITFCGVKIKIKNKRKEFELSLKNQIQGVEKQVKMLKDQTKDIFESRFEKCQEELKSTRNYIETIFESQKLSSRFEKERCRELYEQIDKENFLKLYQNLIKNLDDNSIDCVSKILSRVQQIATSNNARFDIFTEEEIKQFKNLKKEFHSQIIKISDEVWAYKQYLLPIKHFESSVFYYKHQLGDLKNIDSFKDKDIIDAGGFIGDSAIVFSPYTNGNVYTFEPTTQNYNMMLETIKLNESKNIVPVKLGLGSKDEVLEINIDSSASSINRVLHENLQKESIHITTLDKFVEEHNLKVGLIKVDIEGFEQEFLRGALNTIKTQKPTLLLSIYHNADDFFNIKPFIESLDLGYSLKIVRPNDGGVRGETLLICE